MGLIGGIWMIMLGVVGLLDRKLSHAFAPDGALLARSVGAVVWSILAFAIGGTSALWGAWTSLSSMLNTGWISIAPLYWVTHLIVGLIQACLGAVMVIGGIRKLVGKPSFLPLLTLILSGVALAAGGWLIVAGLLLV